MIKTIAIAVVAFASGFCLGRDDGRRPGGGWQFYVDDTYVPVAIGGDLWLTGPLILCRDGLPYFSEAPIHSIWINLSAIHCTSDNSGREH